jgi:hypothetical protein
MTCIGLGYLNLGDVEDALVVLDYAVDQSYDIGNARIRSILLYDAYRGLMIAELWSERDEIAKKHLGNALSAQPDRESALREDYRRNQRGRRMPVLPSASW